MKLPIGILIHAVAGEVKTAVDLSLVPGRKEFPRVIAPLDIEVDMQVALFDTEAERNAYHRGFVSGHRGERTTLVDECVLDAVKPLFTVLIVYGGSVARGVHVEDYRAGARPLRAAKW